MKALILFQFFSLIFLPLRDLGAEMEEVKFKSWAGMAETVSTGSLQNLIPTKEQKY